MYLSKKDYDFLQHLHDNFLCKSITQANKELYAEDSLWNEDGSFYSDEIRLAHYMSEEDYVYFVTMLIRLKYERDKYNNKQKVVMQEKRKINKNYGRGYDVVIRKRYKK